MQNAKTLFFLLNASPPFKYLPKKLCQDMYDQNTRSSTRVFWRGATRMDVLISDLDLGAQWMAVIGLPSASRTWQLGRGSSRSTMGETAFY